MSAERRTLVCAGEEPPALSSGRREPWGQDRDRHSNCVADTTVSSRGFFTIGGLLARAWRPVYPLLPWALTSALLMVAGMWDYWSHGGRIEWVVVGLSAYELMIGLLALPQPLSAPSVPGVHPSRQPESGPI